MMYIYIYIYIFNIYLTVNPVIYILYTYDYMYIYHIVVNYSKCSKASRFTQLVGFADSADPHDGSVMQKH